MKNWDRREVWIHTHFLTNCIRLSRKQIQEISREITPFLRQLGIVSDIHFEEHKTEEGIRIVLECIPFNYTQEQIQQKLQEIVVSIPIKPIPAKKSEDCKIKT